MALKIVTGGTTGAADGTLVSSSNKITFTALSPSYQSAHMRCDDGYWSNDQAFTLPAELEVSFDGGSTWKGVADNPITAPEIEDVNYAVRFRQVSGAAIAASSFTTTGTFTAITALADVTSFAATVVGPTAIDLSWAAVANRTYYKIERATDAGFTANLTTLTSTLTATSYSDTGLTSGTTYYYRIKALGTGRYSDSASFATANGTPARVFPSVLANTKLQFHFQEGSGTSVNDESSNNYDGTITAGSGAWGTSSPPGGALDSYFDCASSLIAVPSGANLLQSDGTIEAVVKFDTLGSAIEVIYREGKQSPSTGRLYLWMGTDSKPLLAGTNSLAGPSALSTGTWYYLVGAWDSGVQKIYVNGSEVATANTNGRASAADATRADFGGRPAPDSDLYLDGKLAFLAVSSVRRTGAEILARAQAMGFA